MLYDHSSTLTSYSIVRSKVNPLIEHWQRICILAERIIKRREAAAVRNTPAFFQRRPPSTHASSPAIPSSPTTSLSGSTTLPTPSVLGESILNTFGFGLLDQQSDLSRLTNTLRAAIEVNDRCWRGDDCELSNGVRQGLEQVAIHTQRQSELSEIRVRVYSPSVILALIQHRLIPFLTRHWKL